MLLSEANKTKETRVKQASKAYHFRVLRQVKAKHLQMNWLQIEIMCDNCKWL